MTRISLIKLFLFSLISFSNDEDSLKVFNLEEVGVSANAKIRSSAIAYDELNKEQIELKTSSADLPYILDGSTSVYTYSENGNNMGYSNLRLRGFDQRRVMVYINGVPINDPELHNVFWINYSDLQESIGQIQVQRGAGINGFGNSSIAGAISINTNNLINEPGLRVGTSFGYQEFGGIDQVRANTSKFTAEYSSGLVDGKYSFYGKLGRLNSGGYRNESWLTATNYFFSATRYDDRLTTQFNVFGGSQTDGLAYSGISKNDVGDLSARRANPFNYNGQEQESFSSPHFQLLNNYKVSENVTLNSSLFYFEGEGYFDYNGGSLNRQNLGISSATYAGNDIIENTVLRGYVGNRQGGWIPTINYNLKNGELITGAEIRIHRSGHWGDIQYAEGLEPFFDRNFKIFRYNSGKNVFSIFAKENYQATEKLNVNLEGQLVYKNYMMNDLMLGEDQVSYLDQNGEPTGAEVFNIDYLFFNPRLSANYNISEKYNVYASAAYANREPRRNQLVNGDDIIYGGVPNFASSTSGSVTQYDFDNSNITPERAFDLELGGNLATKKVNAGINLYYLAYQDELVGIGAVDLYGSPIDVNISQTRHFGIELNASHNWNLPGNSKLGFDVNFMYSVNEIVDHKYETTDLNGNEVTLDLSGNTLAGFADYILNLGLDYKIDNLMLRFDLKHVSDIYWNNLNEDQQTLVSNSSNTIDNYYLVNFNASYKFTNVLGYSDILFKVQINNLTNELYAPFANNLGYFPAAERNFRFGIELGI